MDDFPLAKHIKLHGKKDRKLNNDVKTIKLEVMAARADSKRLDFLERHLPKVNLQVV